jgi:hypothetical protein
MDKIVTDKAFNFPGKNKNWDDNIISNNAATYIKKDRFCTKNLFVCTKFGLEPDPEPKLS